MACNISSAQYILKNSLKNWENVHFFLELRIVYAFEAELVSSNIHL